MEKRIKVSKDCTFNCIFCSDLDIRSSGNPSIADIEADIIDAEEDTIILPCNSDHRKDIRQILEMIMHHGKKIVLETNAAGFSEEKLCEDLLGLIDKVVIFSFGQDTREFDATAQKKGSFERYQKGAKNIKALLGRERVGSLKWHPDISEVILDKPTEVVIETTSRCNLNCKGCFNKASFARLSRDAPEMKTQKIKEIIDSIADAGIERVRFSGGEPLLRDDLSELIAYAAGKKLKVWLNTNGTLITESFVRKIEDLVGNVLIPFNGYDEDSDLHWTMAKGSFEKKLAGLRLLKDSKILVVRAGTVATADNIRNLEKIYDVIKRNGLTSWEVWRPISLSKDNEDIDAQTLYKKLISLSLDFGKMIPIANSVPFCSYDMKKMSIVSNGGIFDDGHSRVVIDPAGFAKPSYFIDENIGDPSDIMACWNHPFMKKMRNLGMLPTECRGCDYRQICKGGTRYMAKLHYGNYADRDPLMRS